MGSEPKVCVDNQFWVKVSSLEDIPRIENLFARARNDLRREAQKDSRSQPRLDHLGWRVFFFRTILERALENWLLHKAPKAEVDKVLRVTINGRQYWYRGEQRTIVEWVKLIWPPDEIQDVEITAESQK